MTDLFTEQETLIAELRQQLADFDLGWQARERGEPQNSAAAARWQTGWDHYEALEQIDALTAQLAAWNATPGDPRKGDPMSTHVFALVRCRCDNEDVFPPGALGARCAETLTAQLAARDAQLAQWRAVLAQYADPENWDRWFLVGGTGQKTTWVPGGSGYALAQEALATERT